MDREIKQLLGLFGTLISALIALGSLSVPMELHTFKLTLTGEGCIYAQSVGLPVERSNGICSAEVRFQPHQISSGGVLQLDNDKKITITDSMLLATARSDNDLPFTPSQREGLMWAFGWIVVTIVVGGVTFYNWGRKENNPRKQP